MPAPAPRTRAATKPTTANGLTTAILSYLFAQRVFAWRAQSTGLFDARSNRFRTAPKKGVSDILAVQPPHGRLLAIEVKIGSDRLRPEQEGFLATVERMGGRSFVAKDLESFEVWYNTL